SLVLFFHTIEVPTETVVFAGKNRPLIGIVVVDCFFTFLGGLAATASVTEVRNNAASRPQQNDLRDMECSLLAYGLGAAGVPGPGGRGRGGEAGGLSRRGRDLGNESEGTAAGDAPRRGGRVADDRRLRNSHCISAGKRPGDSGGRAGALGVVASLDLS